MFLNAIVMFAVLNELGTSWKCHGRKIHDLCTKDSKHSEMCSNHGKLYHFKGDMFGIFNIFSRLQVSVTSEKPFRIFLQSDLDDLTKDMKDQENGILSTIFYKTIGRFAPQSNKNETRIELSPFIDKYIGILFDGNEGSNVTVYCHQNPFDGQLLALFIIGNLLFFCAESCSRNVLFYYASGVTIGLLMSWMVILIIVLKLMPYKKSLFVATMMTGGSMGLYITQNLLLNLNFYAKYHAYWLMWYTAIVSVLTMAFLYYKGPPSNVRFLNLTKWAMQLLGLLSIYNSTWATEVAVTAIVFTMATYAIAMHFDVGRVFKTGLSCFLPYKFYNRQEIRKRRLLTEEEYQEEAQRETSKALEELRGYCSSPECDSWRVVSRLKDPKRFADFIKTGAMFKEDEVEEYDKFEVEEENSSWLSSDNEQRTDDTFRSEKKVDDILQVSDNSFERSNIVIVK